MNVLRASVFLSVTDFCQLGVWLANVIELVNVVSVETCSRFFAEARGAVVKVEILEVAVLV